MPMPMVCLQLSEEGKRTSSRGFVLKVNIYKSRVVVYCRLLWDCVVTLKNRKYK